MATSTVELSIEEEFGCKNALDLDAPWSHWFLYGDTGTGKTSMAATFPQPLFIVPQNEHSITTLRGLNVPYFEVCDMDKTKLNPKTGIGSMMGVLDKIETRYRADPNTFPFNTIVVESLTHYGDLVQEQITNGGVKAMAQNDWNTVASSMRTLQSRARAFELHFVFTALAKTESSEDGKTLIGGPHLTGQLATKFPSACDVIGYCEVIRGKTDFIHRVHFRQHRHFPARSRFRRLPAFIDNFNFADIQGALDPDEIANG